MTVAFFLGFYNRVESDLRNAFASEFDSGILVWYGSDSRHRPFDINAFKARLSTLLRDSSVGSVLLFLVVVRGQDPWVRSAIEAIVGGDARVRLVIMENALDSTTLMRSLNEVGISAHSEEIGEARLVQYLGGSMVLCVRATWQTGFHDALARAQFPSGAVQRYFTERVVPPAQNSNLIQELRAAARQYDHLLYAYRSLRYMPRDVKREFKGKFFQDETTAGVVAKLKTDILR